MAERRDWFLLKADIAEADDRLRALRTPQASDTPPGPAELSRAIARAVGVGVAGIEPAILRGTFRWVVFAALADGRRVVARINRLGHPALAEGLVLEERLAARLRPLGIPAPAVLAVDLSGAVLPAAFAVAERLEGATLGDLEGDEAAVLAGLRSFGAVLRRLHEVRLPGAGPLDVAPLAGRFPSWGDYLRTHADDHLAACARAGALDAAEAARAARLLEELAAGSAAGPADRVLHGDPGGPNVFLSADRAVSGLVDWEDALVGEPLFELASCACFHPERRWSSLFEGYGVGPALPAADRRRFWLLVLRIALARTVMRERFAVADLPGRAPAAGRVRRALRALEGGAGAA